MYGQLIPTNSRNKNSQHSGLGTRLLSKAERISQLKGYRYIAVISGVGTREYYRKRGYEIVPPENYMVKYIGAWHDVSLCLILLLVISLLSYAMRLVTMVHE